jgi:ABC-type lipoprotein release transport system permease subunit
VVALTVAFLVGTTLLVLAAGSQTAAIAGEYGTSGAVERYDTVADARAVAPPDAVVLPMATAERTDGTTVRVVARTTAGKRFRDEHGIRLFDAEEGVTSGLADDTGTARLAGETGSRTVEVQRRGRSVLDGAWHVAPRGVVEDLGPTGALVVRLTGKSTPERGVPLLSALAFFVAGTRETLQALSVAALGGGLLVGVTVYSVVRMTVRDRLETIRIVRATGGPPRHVLAVFALRGGLLAGAGTALGYAIGVIVPSVAVNAAVYVGLPTSLAIEVTPRAAGVVVPVMIGIPVIGVIGGLLAAIPAVRTPPGTLRASGAKRGRSERWFAPRLLGWRAFVPTAATLTAFVLFAALVVAMAGAVAPLASADGATITEPGAVHPVASKVPEGYADALRARGVNASPEILAFAVEDGRPFVARGVNATAFTRVSDADLQRGRYPRNRSEAVVGTDLARTRGIDVGERVLLGGSTTPAVSEVEVVGVASARGILDDQLLVSLPTARHLANMPPDRVQFVRAERVPDAPTDGAAGVVVIRAPNRVAANGTLSATIVLRNAGLEARTTTVTIAFAGQERTRTAKLAPGERRGLDVQFSTDAPGTYTLSAGNVTRTVEVVTPGAIEIMSFPGEAPPGSAPRIQVRTLAGDPVEGATVSVNGTTVATTSGGTARVPLGEAGGRIITVQQGNQTASANVSVFAGADRALSGGVQVHPEAPLVTTAPEARLTLSNPWNRTLSRTVQIDAPGGDRTRTVEVSPGETETVTVSLPRRPPGTYEVSATIDGRTVAATTYEVTGDDRIAAAIAGGTTTGGSGIGEAIETAFGNLELVLGAIVVLAGLMTAGGTTASFARAVHARRRTIGIYRATGAAPERVLARVLRETLVIGALASMVALAVGVIVLVGFDAAGLLAPFGVRLGAIPDPGVALGIVLGALLIALLGATLATVGHLRATPASLLAGEQGPPRGQAGVTAAKDREESDRIEDGVAADGGASGGDHHE